MTAEALTFWLLAPVSLGAAIAMVLMRNAVHAALMLVVNLFTIAVFYALLEAQFLAVVQIIVYAGAIMVLFLFVLMLTGVNRDEPRIQRIRGQGPAALLLGLALLAFLVPAVAGGLLGSDAACPSGPAATEAVPPEAVPAEATRCQGLAEANADGNVRGVGRILFTDYVWPFEVTSALLVIAALGAMVLGRRHEDPADLVDVPPDAHDGDAHDGDAHDEDPAALEAER